MVGREGMFKFALVNAAGDETFWSNDGTSSAGGEPSKAVALTVKRGLYSVLLGDATLANMTAMPASVFADRDEVFIRVWFDDGVNGSQQLSPDQRIAAVGYAIMASSVADGAITSTKLADGAVTSEKLADGAVGASQLADGAAAANIAAAGKGLVLSTEKEDPNLIAAGLVNVGDVVLRPDTWSVISTDGDYTIGARAFGGNVENPAGVWTGDRLIIWSGRRAGAYVQTGAGYDPVSDTWDPITSVGAPTGRIEHTAVWTGNEMIVWGGSGEGFVSLRGS